MPDPIADVFAKRYDAFLFDMDGTLLNSILAAERVWSRWAEKHGLNVEEFLPNMHGKRGIDTIAELNLPGVDPKAEALEVERGEIEDVEGVVAIPGAVEFLASLPADRWSIVTSAPIALAKARLAAAGIDFPPAIVTAEDVEKGKPDPSGYKLAASRLSVDPANCLVFEDVMAGVRAGEGAGADVVVITSTHTHPLKTDHLTIPDYTGFKPVVDSDGRIGITRR